MLILDQKNPSIGITPVCEGRRGVCAHFDEFFECLFCKVLHPHL